MTWYFYIFTFCLIFFILKTVMSWFLSDVDYYNNNRLKFNNFTLLSIQMIIYFLLGFTGILSFLAYNSFDKYLNGFTFTDFCLAFIAGVVLTLFFWWLYNNNSFDKKDLNGYECTILKNLKNGKYEARVKTPSGNIDITVYSFDRNEHFPKKSKHFIVKNNKGKYFI